MAEIQAVKNRYCAPIPIAKDARGTVRYSLRASVTFRWSDQEGVEHEGRGETRDISPRGIFIFSEQCPPRGALLSLKIRLPSVGAVTREPARGLLIKAEGEVLRVELRGRAGTLAGFSTQNQWMRYAKPDES